MTISELLHERARQRSQPGRSTDDLFEAALTQDISGRISANGETSGQFRIVGAAAVFVLVLAVALAVRVRSGDSATGIGRRSDTPPNAVEWATPFAELSADDLRIETSGLTFLGQAPDVDLESDPGRVNEYTTLERRWQEHGVEMRLIIYFESDGRDWWSDELWIYDGSPQGKWVTFIGQRFRTPLGSPFVGDLDLRQLGTPSSRLTMTGLRLQAFLTPQICTQHPGRLGVEVLYPEIRLSTDPALGGSLAVRLRDGQCRHIVDVSAFTFEWSVGDSSLVGIVAIPHNCELKEPACRTRVHVWGLKQGETSLTVRVRRIADGSDVAAGTMHVTIGDLSKRRRR